MHDEDGILALDPEQISDREVREVLSRAPAPRVLAFRGSFLADMVSFRRFLVAMGYPVASIDLPEVTWQGCVCLECERIVGAMAWHYEQEGMVPMLVGHSGGGVVVSRLLYTLAEADEVETSRRLQVWNPVTSTALPRSTVRDPATGASRRLSELAVPYAAVLGTGTLARRLPGFAGCAADTRRLAAVPDAVAEFTAYRIDGDAFTLGMAPYRPTGKATVRNVPLPSTTSHVQAFEMAGLAEQPGARAWISSYRPGTATDPATVPQAPNILQAADLWHSVKKHWCLQAQRLIKARRALHGEQPAP